MKLSAWLKSLYSSSHSIIHQTSSGAPVRYPEPDIADPTKGKSLSEWTDEDFLENRKYELIKLKWLADELAANLLEADEKNYSARYKLETFNQRAEILEDIRNIETFINLFALQAKLRLQREKLINSWDFRLAVWIGTVTTNWRRRVSPDSLQGKFLAWLQRDWTEHIVE